MLVMRGIISVFILTTLFSKGRSDGFSSDGTLTPWNVLLPNIKVDKIEVVDGKIFVLAEGRLYSKLGDYKDATADKGCSENTIKDFTITKNADVVTVYIVCNDGVWSRNDNKFTWNHIYKVEPDSVEVIAISGKGDRLGIVETKLNFPKKQKIKEAEISKDGVGYFDDKNLGFAVKTMLLSKDDDIISLGILETVNKSTFGIFHNGQWRHTSALQRSGSLFESCDTIFITDETGGIIQSHDRGRSFHDVDTPSRDVSAVLCVDEYMFVGTKNHGMYVAVQDGKYSYHSLEGQNYFPSNTIFDIKEDDGNIYVATSKGLAIKYGLIDFEVPKQKSVDLKRIFKWKKEYIVY